MLSLTELPLDEELLEALAAAAWAASKRTAPNAPVSPSSKDPEFSVGGNSPSSSTPMTIAPLPCVRECCERLSLRENFFPHSLHSKGLSCV